MSIGAQSPQHFECATTRKVRVRYLLFLPRGDQAKENQRWPLILFLHGAGERGTNLSKIAVHGPPRIVKDQPDFPFIVVSPQCPNRQLWSNEFLLPLLDDVMEKYKADPRRVYLTGLSMGGYGAWSLALAHPERFAALAPICGGGDILPVLLAGAQQRRALRTLGIWAFHGAKDPIVPLAESERMVAALRDVGNHVRLTVYPEGGHDSWTETYNNPALYKWFLSQQRPTAAGPARLQRKK
jgi:predicted peptidase